MKEKYNAKLLVEGVDDKHVIYALAEKFHLKENFDVVDCGSVESVYKQLELRLTNPANLSSIGIVVDADQNVSDRFGKFLNILNSTFCYDVKNIAFTQNGVLLHPNDKVFPVVGIWVMPNNSSEGMIEDFVMSLTSTEDKQLLHKADVVLDELKKEGLQRFKDVHRSKAKVHTYLAWQAHPGLPLGVSITAKAFDANVEFAKKFDLYG